MPGNEFRDATFGVLATFEPQLNQCAVVDDRQVGICCLHMSQVEVGDICEHRYHQPPEDDWRGSWPERRE